MKHHPYTFALQWLAFKAMLVYAIFFMLGSRAQTNSSDKVHLGFIYPISTHGTHALADTNNFSLHVLAGVSAAENGIAISGLTNVVRYDVKGIAIAGFSNHISKKAEGILFAGFLNTYGTGKGLQFAGFSNVATGQIDGAQFSGFLNKSGNITGAQFAGFANVAQQVEGSQFAGFINIARQTKDSSKVGSSTIASKAIKGSQFAGFANIAHTVRRSQFAGFINVAKKVQGAQFAGFINIADSCDYPVGIINIVKNGEKNIGISVDENQTTLVSFRSGGKIMYGIIGLGFNFKNDEEVYAFEAGIGAHFFDTKSFRLNIELAGVNLESFKPGEYFKSSARVLPAIKLGRRLEIFGGPVLNYIITNTTEGEVLNKHYFASYQNRRSDNFRAAYLGYTGGLTIKL